MTRPARRPLGREARAELRDAGITPAEWARRHSSPDGTWYGDRCGCPDDRCTGYHHEAGQPCGCLRVLLDDFAR